MRTLLISILLCVSCICKADTITFSKWDCTAISESINKDGQVEYAVHYKKERYTLTEEQYLELLAGKDITINTNN